MGGGYEQATVKSVHCLLWVGKDLTEYYHLQKVNNFFNMKLLLLISVTVAFLATEANALKCYNCAGEDCTTELECPSGTDSCLKTSAGEKYTDGVKEVKELDS